MYRGQFAKQQNDFITVCAKHHADHLMIVLDSKRKLNVSDCSRSCCWRAVRLVFKLDLQHCILQVLSGSAQPSWWVQVWKREQITLKQSGGDLYLGGVLSTRQALKPSTVFTGLEESLSVVQREEVACSARCSPGPSIWDQEIPLPSKALQKSLLNLQSWDRNGINGATAF